MLTKTLQTAVAVATLAIPTVVLSPIEALAAIQDFRVHNQSGLTMVALQVSPSSSDYFNGNVLAAPLRSGYYTTIVAGSNVSGCVFDIRAIFNDGAYLDYYGVNLCVVADVSVP